MILYVILFVIKGSSTTELRFQLLRLEGLNCLLGRAPTQFVTLPLSKLLICKVDLRQDIFQLNTCTGTYLVDIYSCNSHNVVHTP